MSVPARGFSARVQLPCRVFCGPDSILELSGVAVSIDTGSLVLALPARDSSQSMPQPGDKVRLGIEAPPDVLVLREELQEHQSSAAPVTEGLE